tara:strand:- start:1769 stop:1912 length:144 start_codon:yes stop_codon:yes gene_type:complete
MWQHDCPEEGKIEMGDNEPCSWCGAAQLPVEYDPVNEKIVIEVKKCP